MTNEKRTPGLTLLKLEGKEHPVFFVLAHDRYHADLQEEQGHQSYFFEEHSCPINWISECVAVIENGDPDPHGFLKFVRAAEVPAEFDPDDDAALKAIFPEAFQQHTAGDTLSSRVGDLVGWISEKTLRQMRGGSSGIIESDRDDFGTIIPLYRNADGDTVPLDDKEFVAVPKDAFKAIKKAVEINDGDTLSMQTPDTQVIWSASGSWSGGASVTLGDLRKLVRGES